MISSACGELVRVQKIKVNKTKLSLGSNLVREQASRKYVSCEASKKMKLLEDLYNEQVS